jgi:tetratricopeptide (TPR) repeat protein
VTPGSDGLRWAAPPGILEHPDQPGLMRVVRSLLVIAAAPVALAAQEVHPSGHAHDRTPALGTIVFPNSGKAAAQAPFLKGVALLHSFEYEAAADAFRAAQKADPALALAYYGEALSYSHVIWRYEDLPASRAALARLGPTPMARIAKGKTPLETLFATAVETFYKEGTLDERVKAYADAMDWLATRQPDDPEAAAFASHALMMRGFMVSGAARDSIFRRAIALAQRVATGNPNHPGATHYLIHLYDSPGMAKEGLAFARAYDKIAPDAEHALHMPSHIYLQLGMWDDVVRSNERAWAASRSGAHGGADWHAFAWLHYAYLQQRRVDAALALIDTARRLIPNADAAYIDARYVLARLQFQQNAETGEWTTPIPVPPASAGTSDRERGFRNQSRTWLAVAAAMRSDSAEMARLAPPFLALADSVDQGAAVPPGAAATALVIRALVLEARRDSAGAAGAWRAALRAERRLDAFVGPPERVFAAELLAERLIGKTSSVERRQTPALAADAIAGLENVLRACPERTRAKNLLIALR